MSRIGLKPVSVPEGVSVTIEENTVKVKGNKGELTRTFKPMIDFTVDTGQIVVGRKNESRQARAMHGLCRSLLNNMVIGVSQGFRRNLVINGVGFRAEVKNKILVLNLGYSNPVEYVIPDGIHITVEDNNGIAVRGIMKDLVGQTAAEIRSLRPPEPYKGKGIRYENENVRRKVGKSGAK